MFTRHVYTCPDVIYLRNRQKRINHASIGLTILIYGGLYLYGLRVTKQIDQNIEELHQS